MAIEKEVNRRKTFAIISHPDAGKTTLTEKLLLFGGAIRLAGTVKGRKSTKYAVSDWMEIEKERGISVTSSVLNFDYNGFRINILDTPGHQDFSEDTYRTLTAADSAVMLIDGAKGVEEQTKKLFHVCRMRGIPIFTFVNKLDRSCKNPLALMEEISETAAEKHSYNPILRGWIAQSGADYAALGHVHEKSGLCRAGSTFYAYPGCPEARGFDEPGPRGVYIGSISKGSVDISFVPVNQRSYFCPEISVAGAVTQQQIEDRILSFLRSSYGENFAHDAYRITLSGALPPDFTPNLTSLRDRLGTIVFAVKIKDNTNTLIDTEELRRENSLKGVFADIMLGKLEQARAGGDTEHIHEYELALTLGLRAFEGEVNYCED